MYSLNVSLNEITFTSLSFLTLLIAGAIVYLFFDRIQSDRRKNNKKKPDKNKKDASSPTTSYLSAALFRSKRGHLVVHWRRIFSFLQPKEIDRIQLRYLCRLFREVFPPPSYSWTSFPHPKYSSLRKLLNKLNSVFQKNPNNAPEVLFVMKGTFSWSRMNVFTSDSFFESVETFAAAAGYNSSDKLVINYPLKMIGAGQNKTFLSGYRFFIEGTNKEGTKRVVLQDMTLRMSSWHGLFGNNGLSFVCKRMTFTQCGWDGVKAMNTKGRLINCVITQCGYSGIVSSKNALIELEGSQTKVDGNVTSRDSDWYGLETYNTTSRIHLLYPLTKEAVSTNNGGGGNYGSRSRYGGTILTVDTLESVCK